jgi:hypothetical protein
MILLIMLTSCSFCDKSEAPKPTVIVKTKVITPYIPSEYLSPTTPPPSSLLNDVEIASGKDSLLSYLKELYDAWLQDSMKIKSLSSLLDLNITGVKK